MRMHGWCLVIALLVGAGMALAESKFTSLDGFPSRTNLEVAPDGSRVYIAGTDYLVIDDQGQLVTKWAFAPWGTNPVDLMPLPDGWYLALVRGLSGRVDLHRPDGSVAKAIITLGNNERQPHGDPNWSNPDGMAVDTVNKRIFILDSTEPGREPSPNWSRIAIFDYEGKYLGDIGRYDAKAPDAGEKDNLRVTYRDIEVDPARQRVYATTHRLGELRAFSYDGQLLNSIKATGALAVFPDGRVAVSGGRGISIYDPDLKQLVTIPVPVNSNIRDLETDAKGQLYATFDDPAIIYGRWTSNFQKLDFSYTKYARITVEFPTNTITAGQPFTLKVGITGNPMPAQPLWQVMARPTDGSNLTWTMLPVTPGDGTLQVTPPATMNGLYEVAVRCGAGPIAWAERKNDLYTQKTLAILPANATRSVTVFTPNGRRAFRQGETIPLQLTCRAGQPEPVMVTLALEKNGKALTTLRQTVERTLALQLPATVTRRLLPGSYRLTVQAEGYQCYDLPIDIAAAVVDSPLQRILYAEFHGAGSTASRDYADLAERMADVRDYAAAMARKEFSRETERTADTASNDGPRAWRRDKAPVKMFEPGFAPPEFYLAPSGEHWSDEFYYDQAVKYGLRIDSQLLGHCAGTPVSDSSLNRYSAALQRYTQWMSRYPSFYGFNYNDEMFFRSYGWNQDEEAALKALIEGEFKGKPLADVYKYALSRMYERFNAAVRQIKPDVKTTATPMWQYPAIDGSYAPSIYQGLSETYGHYMTEGQHVPWYTAHNTEFLRRPGLPAMGVSDNGHSGGGGDIYMKNVMQALAVGVQGVGIDLTNALGGLDHKYADPFGEDAYRTANLMAKMYGPVFAECPAIKEGAILYSYTQDITERRSTLGTPHWERVYAVLGAGYMAGLPMHIVYEEDVTTGWLLTPDGKPRYPMLFLLGITRPLPQPVQQAISKYRAVGGRIFIDAAGTEYPGAVKLNIDTFCVKDALKNNHNNDSTWPEIQPVLEKLASELHDALAPYRRYPVDAAEPWLEATAFDGGAIRYVMLASETAPYPWGPGAAWSVESRYMRTYLPKRVPLRVPAATGAVIYDVFDHKVVTVKPSNGIASFSADLTTFPGRLYAVAPARLGAPRLSVNVPASAINAKDAQGRPSAVTLTGTALNYQVQATDAQGKPLAARVPLRLRLRAGETLVWEIYRGTDAKGLFRDSVTLPAGQQAWALEATEMLGINAAALTLQTNIPLGTLAVARPDVEIQREAALRSLLADAREAGGLTLVTASKDILTAEQQHVLQQFFFQAGINVTIGDTAPKDAVPALYLTAGYVSAKDTLGALLTQAQNRGLFEYTVSESTPGPGRGFIIPLFSIRGYGEHAVALVGGDAAGLAKTIEVLARWLTQPARPAVPEATPATRITVQYPAVTTTAPALRDMTGPKLTGITVKGNNLLVTADGYLKNVALLRDAGTKAEVVQSLRIGAGPKVGSPTLLPGNRFGVSARVLDRIGEGFFLMDAQGGQPQIFASFGDMAPRSHAFAANDNVVLAPGQFGVVCWRRVNDAWQKSWSLDYWKEFQQLDWPIDNENERLPQFHAYLPEGADYAIIVFAETTNNGWVVAKHRYTAWVAAVSLADGIERWRFNVPIPDTLLFPVLYASPDGSKLMLQVQKDSFGKETFRFYSLGMDGKALAAWDAKVAPRSVAVANGTGLIAEAFSDRLLEVRRPDGTLVYNYIWPGADPVSLAFAPDGQELYVADAAGMLTLLDAQGAPRWRATPGAVSRLAVGADRVYAAGWDGRVRAFSNDGTLLWRQDCTAALTSDNPLALVAEAGHLKGVVIHQYTGTPVTLTTVPPGDNLLAGCKPGTFKITGADGKSVDIKGAGNDKAVVSTGGTKGWLSAGTNTVKAEDLVNGTVDDVTTPWLPLAEVHMTQQTGRQVWVEISFKAPTDVTSLTVYEHKNHPESWPSEGLVQVWDDTLKRWNTACRGVFLHGPITTYPLSLKGVTKLRYAPWNGYYANFYTSEIEVR